LKSLKKHYSNSEIHLVCNKYNFQVAKNYKFIDKIFIINKQDNFLSKIKFFFSIIINRYDICIVIDGKTISKIVSFFIRAKHKYIVCYKKQKKILGFKKTIFRPPLFVCKKFYNTYVLCDETYDKKDVNKEFNNHYLSMYYFLFKKNSINLVRDRHQFTLEESSKNLFNDFFEKSIKSKFISIHIDYKWDSYNIDINIFISILKEISLNNKIIISTGKEGSVFFDKLKKHFVLISFDDSDTSTKKNLSSQNILLVEKLSINLLACFLEKALLHVSSHSGATVHISAAFSVPIIDFIKKSKATEYDRWIPNGISYDRVFVNNLNLLKSSILKNI
tara:strand:+ start:1948 stop:2946 length:999 start_codon:yes stop_codon:yes gene_type:complete